MEGVGPRDQNLTVEETCVICTDELFTTVAGAGGGAGGGVETDVCLLSCSHRFHGPCIQAWRANGGTCPVCRGPIACQHRDLTGSYDRHDRETLLAVITRQQSMLGDLRTRLQCSEDELMSLRLQMEEEGFHQRQQRPSWGAVERLIMERIARNLAGSDAHVEVFEFQRD